ncbi:MAG: hypothetical protein R6U32_07080 [Candidatus Woesearchaeota archaeon]
MMTGKRKGQVGIQFNWIFVIIAGALILGFFVMVVQKQREVSERKLATDLLADLDMIITGQAVSPGSSKTLDMAELELSFTCNDYSIMDVPRTSGNAIIFSPSRMKGRTLLAWTLPWDMPYRTANFIYMTVPEIRYFIVDPAQNNGMDSFGIKDDFPDKVDAAVVRTTPDSYEDYQRVRLVYFQEPQDPEMPLPSPALEDFADEQVSALYIESLDDNELKEEDFDGNAVIHFYRKEEDSLVKKGTWGAMGKETIYGAIFSDDYELYMCNIQKALKKLEVVTGVYGERASSVLEGLPDGDPCSPYYTNEPFEGIIESITGDEVRIGNLFEYKKRIEKLNDRTIFASCPAIY